MAKAKLHEDRVALEKQLRKNGFRVTEQRRVILDVLIACGWQLTAEEIYQEARRINHYINLATVYRTLSMLKETGVVYQYHVSQDHTESHFGLIDSQSLPAVPDSQSVPQSCHFHCLRCGKITVLDSSDLLDALKKALGAQLSTFELRQVCMCSEGYCPTCVKELP